MSHCHLCVSYCRFVYKIACYSLVYIPHEQQLPTNTMDHICFPFFIGKYLAFIGCVA